MGGVEGGEGVREVGGECEGICNFIDGRGVGHLDSEEEEDEDEEDEEGGAHGDGKDDEWFSSEQQTSVRLQRRAMKMCVKDYPR